MIKYSATDIVFDLQDRWETLIYDAWSEEFDYEQFKILASHTFTYLFQFHTRGILPRESLSVLFKIKEFAVIALGGISNEYEAAKLVAQEFCNQKEDSWVEAEDNFEEDTFVVCGSDGVDYLIDANTFDLTKLIESFRE